MLPGNTVDHPLSIPPQAAYRRRTFGRSSNDIFPSALKHEPVFPLPDEMRGSAIFGHGDASSLAGDKPR